MKMVHMYNPSVPNNVWQITILLTNNKMADVVVDVIRLHKTPWWGTWVYCEASLQLPAPLRIEPLHIHTYYIVHWSTCAFWKNLVETFEINITLVNRTLEQCWSKNIRSTHPGSSIYEIWMWYIKRKFCKVLVCMHH